MRRELETHHRTASFAVIDGDESAVRTNNFIGDCETQSRALFLYGVERLQCSEERLFAEAGTAIQYGDNRIRAGSIESDFCERSLCSCVGCLQGVFDEIVKHLPELVAITRDDGRLGGIV